MDYGSASRTTDIDWGKACKSCFDNKEAVANYYGLELPKPPKEVVTEIIQPKPAEITITSSPSNQTFMLTTLGLVLVFGLIIGLLFREISSLKAKADRITGDFDARVDEAVTRWLANYRVEEYTDFLDNRFDLVITKGENKYVDKKHPRK